MTGKLTPSTGLDLICGAGGSRAILGTSGALLASHALEFDAWRTIGGVSGGSIPSLMLAAGKKAPEITRLVIEIDFNSKLTPKTHLLGLWWAFFLKECAWKRRTNRGVLTSEKLGTLINELVPTWPEKYWTVGVAEDGTQVLFTSSGVFEYKSGRPVRMIQDKPADVGLAIRATCAVPGVISAVPFRNMDLLDGALADEGRCPVRVAKEQLGARPGNIVAIDVGEGTAEAQAREHWFFRGLRRLVCGSCCEPDEGPAVDTDGVVLITPDASAVQSLEFKLTPDQKWQTLMAGFVAAVENLSGTGWISPDRIAHGREIVEAFRAIERNSKKPGELAEATSALLTKRGLF